MNKIGWCHRTVNGVVGCLTGCTYCFAIKQAKRQKHRCELCYQFIPHAHLERLDQITPRQKPQRIFMDSMWDWNGIGVKREWTDAIIEKMIECSQHTFQILSKFPEGYSRFDFPSNVWLGTSVESQDKTHRIGELLSLKNDNLKFVSFEPLLEKIVHPLCFLGNCLDWVIIGPLTRGRKKPIQPKTEWVDHLLEICHKDIPVFMKDKLDWPQLIQEFPKKSK